MNAFFGSHGVGSVGFWGFMSGSSSYKEKNDQQMTSLDVDTGPLQEDYSMNENLDADVMSDNHDNDVLSDQLPSTSHIMQELDQQSPIPSKVVPNEVIRMFMEHMSFSQRQAISRVSKIFAFLVKSFWEHIIKEDTKLDVDVPYWKLTPGLSSSKLEEVVSTLTKAKTNVTHVSFKGFDLTQTFEVISVPTPGDFCKTTAINFDFFINQLISKNKSVLYLDLSNTKLSISQIKNILHALQLFDKGARENGVQQLQQINLSNTSVPETKIREIIDDLGDFTVEFVLDFSNPSKTESLNVSCSEAGNVNNNNNKLANRHVSPINIPKSETSYIVPVKEKKPPSDEFCLPNEVMRMLLNHLSTKRMCAVSRVSRVWAFLVKSLLNKVSVVQKINNETDNLDLKALAWIIDKQASHYTLTRACCALDDNPNAKVEYLSVEGVDLTQTEDPLGRSNTGERRRALNFIDPIITFIGYQNQMISYLNLSNTKLKQADIKNIAGAMRRALNISQRFNMQLLKKLDLSNNGFKREEIDQIFADFAVEVILNSPHSNNLAEMINVVNENDSKQNKNEIKNHDTFSCVNNSNLQTLDVIPPSPQKVPASTSSSSTGMKYSDTVIQQFRKILGDDIQYYDCFWPAILEILKMRGTNKSWISYFRELKGKHSYNKPKQVKAFFEELNTLEIKEVYDCVNREFVGNEQCKKTTSNSIESPTVKKRTEIVELLKCFMCHTNGDAIDYVTLFRNVDRPSLVALIGPKISDYHYFKPFFDNMFGPEEAWEHHESNIGHPNDYYTNPIGKDNIDKKVSRMLDYMSTMSLFDVVSLIEAEGQREAENEKRKAKEGVEKIEAVLAILVSLNSN